MLWHAPGSPLPGDLLNSLSRRIGRIAVCTDPFMALAEACSAARGGEGGRGVVLLLVQPERLPDASAVVLETRTFAPAAVCWKYAAGANPALSAIVESDVASWPTADRPGVEPRTRAAAGNDKVAGRGAGDVEQLSSPAHPARTTQRPDRPAEQRALSSDSSPFAPAPRPPHPPHPASPPVPSAPPLVANPAATPTQPARTDRAHAPAAKRVIPSTPPPPPGAPAGDEQSRGSGRGGAPRLRLADDDASDEGPRVPEIVVRRPPPIRPRASGELTLRNDEDAPRPAAPPPRTMLTPEELRMLLGEDEPGQDEHGDRDGRNGSKHP